MTTKRKKIFRWSCGACFEVRLKKGDRTKLEYRQISSRGTNPLAWHSVALDKAIAFAYGAMIPAKTSRGLEIVGEYWTPRGSRLMSDMVMPCVVGWRSTTFKVLKHLGVVTR